MFAYSVQVHFTNTLKRHIFLAVLFLQFTKYKYSVIVHCTLQYTWRVYNTMFLYNLHVQCTKPFRRMQWHSNVASTGFLGETEGTGHRENCTHCTHCTHFTCCTHHSHYTVCIHHTHCTHCTNCTHCTHYTHCSYCTYCVYILHILHTVHVVHTVHSVHFT